MRSKKDFRDVEKLMHHWDKLSDSQKIMFAQAAHRTRYTICSACKILISRILGMLGKRKASDHGLQIGSTPCVVSVQGRIWTRMTLSKTCPLQRTLRFSSQCSLATATPSVMRRSGLLVGFTVNHCSQALPEIGLDALNLTRQTSV